MKTKIIKVSNRLNNEKEIREASDVIRAGGLVAFPTETVYGLGANALDEEAVKKIFAAKNRPTDNPLIVHIAKTQDLESLAVDVPLYVKSLIDKFWPGPLTLVFNKKSDVPDLVTAKGSTVAVRMPNHPIALALIESAGVPIAAPSANLAGRPSATSPQDVFADLDGKVEIIIDGGKTRFGLESTVLDVTGLEPLILRPGAVTKEALEKTLKQSITDSLNIHGTVRSPGMKYRHYAPQAKMVIISYQESICKMISQEELLFRDLRRLNKKVGILATLPKGVLRPKADVIYFAGPTLNHVARNLFRYLRQFDKDKVDIILVEGVPLQGIGAAIMNRLTKAAIGNSINLIKKN